MFILGHRVATAGVDEVVLAGGSVNFLILVVMKVNLCTFISEKALEIDC